MTRVKHFIVGLDVLTSLFTHMSFKQPPHKVGMPCFGSDLPPDAQIVGMHWSPENSNFHLHVQSKHFDEVSHGAAFPIETVSMFYFTLDERYKLDKEVKPKPKSKLATGGLVRPKSINVIPQLLSQLREEQLLAIINALKPCDRDRLCRDAEHEDLSMQGYIRQYLSVAEGNLTLHLSDGFVRLGAFYQGVHDDWVCELIESSKIGLGQFAGRPSRPRF